MTDEVDAVEVVLEADELLVIEHLLTPSELQSVHDGTGFVHPCLPSKETCLKIGCAWMEAQRTQAAQKVVLNARELWIMRERVDVFAALSTSPKLGIELKQKIYTALSEIDAVSMMGSRLVSDHAEQSAREVLDALRNEPES